MTSQLGKISGGSCSLGGDPEFFLYEKGELVGSEKAIPAKGLLSSSKITRDGIQVEMNICPFGCRQSGGGQVKQAFILLNNHLKGKYEISWERLVEVSPDLLQSLSPESRKLGCEPSFNLYDPSAEPGVDGEAYLKRSAGGHIHIGLPDLRTWTKEARMILVNVMDAIVGSTCVLLDPSPLNAIRREVYGRAGEYRIPKHGLEYRSLSNFWLEDYILFHFVMGLTKLAVGTVWAGYLADSYKYDPFTGTNILTDPKPNEHLTSLLGEMDQVDIIRAINENDADLAWKNWKVLKKWFKGHVYDYGRGHAGNVPGTCGLTHYNLDQFEDLAEGIQAGRLKEIFPGDPLKNWLERTNWGGSETWLTNFKLPKKLRKAS